MDSYTELMSSLNELHIAVNFVLLFKLIELTLGELQTVLQVLDLSGQVIHSFIIRIQEYLDKTLEAIFLLL